MTTYPLRGARWTPFLVMACTAMCFLATRLSAGDDPEVAVETVRAVTLLLALGCCAALDDPAAPILAASPTRLWRRRAGQAAVTLVPAAVLWLVAVVMTVSRSDASAALTGLVLEAATLIAVVCTAALLAQCFGIHEPSPIAGSVTVAAGLAILGLPHSVSLFTAFDNPAWPAAHQRWTAILVALTLIAACAVRDPASRRFHRFAQRRPSDDQYWPDPRELS